MKHLRFDFVVCLSALFLLVGGLFHLPGSFDSVSAQAEDPSLVARISRDSVTGHSFQPNSQVTLTIFTSDHTQALFGPAAVPTDEFGNFFADIFFHHVDIQPGLFIEASDSTNFRELQVAFVKVEQISYWSLPDSLLISGSSEPDSHLSIHIGQFTPSGEQNYNFPVVADTKGEWSFSLDNSVVDLRYMPWVNVGISDEDWDLTTDDRSRYPMIETGRAGPGPGYYLGLFTTGWPINASLIFNLYDAQGELVAGPIEYQADESGTFPPQGWMIGDCYDFCGYDWLPDMKFSVSDGTTTKELIPIDVTIDDVDPDLDTASGRAPSDSMLEVQLDDVPWSLILKSDSLGNWHADFNSIGVDVPEGIGAMVHAFDEDGDITIDYFSPILAVEIDIKPGSYPNCFNNDGHGVIPVAILSSSDFDALSVDPSSVMLDGQLVRMVGKGNVQSTEDDVNKDGFVDLVVKIEGIDGVYSEGDSVGTLTGSTFEGLRIKGEDSICVMP